MKKILSALMILIVALCAGCGEKITYKHLSQEEATKMMADTPDAIILDARTRDEYEKKHIPGAILIPLEDLRKNEFAKIPDKNATILIYCWTGRRAQDSADVLVKNGYKNVYEFGGLADWNGPLEGGDIDGYKYITQDEAVKMLAEDPSAVLVDCRFPKDYEARHITGAIHVPLEAVVAENFEQIPDKNATLITYCGDGNRGRKTAKALVEKGYTKVYTMGGIIEWTGDVEGADVKAQ
ncbi:MAG: hypothetical protein IJL12_08230 [Selenomonadaceae bacterium]|nr:hypothetical protein [Selenomonadaceae bacterium]MBQ6132307.1 hypothetical protein [Selenomonadaceae bacterium]